MMHQLHEKQLDQILIDRDVYRMTSQYLNNLDKMHAETTQLPKVVALSHGQMYEVNYIPLIYCTVCPRKN